MFLRVLCYILIFIFLDILWDGIIDLAMLKIMSDLNIDEATFEEEIEKYIQNYTKSIYDL